MSADGGTIRLDWTLDLPLELTVNGLRQSLALCVPVFSHSITCIYYWMVTAIIVFCRSSCCELPLADSACSQAVPHTQSTQANNAAGCVEPYPSISLAWMMCLIITTHLALGRGSSKVSTSLLTRLPAAAAAAATGCHGNDDDAKSPHKSNDSVLKEPHKPHYIEQHEQSLIFHGGGERKRQHFSGSVLGLGVVIFEAR